MEGIVKDIPSVEVATTVLENLEPAEKTEAKKNFLEALATLQESISESLPVSLMHNNDNLDDNICGDKLDKLCFCCKPRKFVSWCLSLVLIIPALIKFVSTFVTIG